MFNPETTPNTIESQESAARLLGLPESATPKEIVERYDQMIEGDKRVSEWEPERNTFAEMHLPVWVDRIVEDLRQAQADSFLESVGFDMSTINSVEKLPSMSQIASVLYELGFNVTESDKDIMIQAINELKEKNDEGIDALPPGAERALGME